MSLSWIDFSLAAKKCLIGQDIHLFDSIKFFLSVYFFQLLGRPTLSRRPSRQPISSVFLWCQVGPNTCPGNFCMLILLSPFRTCTYCNSFFLSAITISDDELWIREIEPQSTNYHLVSMTIDRPVSPLTSLSLSLSVVFRRSRTSPASTQPWAELSCSSAWFADYLCYRSARFHIYLFTFVY